MENERDEPPASAAADPTGEPEWDTAPEADWAELGEGADEDPSGFERLTPGASSALPPKLEAWRKRSAAGAILTGFALGLQEALERRKEEPSIVMETSGNPPKDLPVEAEFEYGRPRQSVVQIRPWLLPDGTGSPAADSPAADSPAADSPAPDSLEGNGHPGSATGPADGDRQ
ncbi:MAG: hypothetical protein M0Z30_19435 [Actinomycetota bacterium]|nr:hypothetical protein [Actinomycetota bacterium]